MMPIRQFSMLILVASALSLLACQSQDCAPGSGVSESDSNISIAKKMYETLIAGDMEGAYALMADDIRWTYHGGEGTIPFSGEYKGHAGIKRFFDDYDKVAMPLGMQIDTYSSSGDTVFVRGVENARIIATGKTYAAPWVHVIRIENHKIVSYDEYIDSAMVADAFRK